MGKSYTLQHTFRICGQVAICRTLQRQYSSSYRTTSYQVSNEGRGGCNMLHRWWWLPLIHSSAHSLSAAAHLRFGGAGVTDFLQRPGIVLGLFLPLDSLMACTEDCAVSLSLEKCSCPCWRNEGGNEGAPGQIMPARPGQPPVAPGSLRRDACSNSCWTHLWTVRRGYT